MMTEKPIAKGTAADFLLAGGEMGERIQSFDWAAHPLGPIKNWPQSLKIVLRIMLTSRYAMWLGWGPEFYFFCNDAYLPTVGLKESWVLGTSARTVWEEIWQDIGPRAESVVQTGIATWDEGLQLFLERKGYSEETYHTFSYSPVPNDNGTIGGMLCVVTEETERIIGERRLALLRELAADLTEIKTEETLFQIVLHHLSVHNKDLPFALIYLFDEMGKEAHLVCAPGATAGENIAPEQIQVDSAEAVWPVREVLVEGEVVLIPDLAAHFAKGASSSWEQLARQAILVPIAQQGQSRPAGVLVAGINPYRPLDLDYRGFIDLLAGQIAAALSNARVYEAERKRAEALAEIDRAKTTFFSNVSHEFRTPLTLMLGPLHDLLAESDAVIPSEQRELLDVAHRNGQRLLKLVNTLLDFSRIEAGRLKAVYEPVDLATYTTDLASIFRSAIEKAGMELLVDCPPLPEAVYVDRDMWEKIVSNLISNAFKYTLEGWIRVSLRAENGQAKLTVEDTGIGIPAAELPNLFNRFHRVEGARGRTHEGTGIGLALVQELVSLHKGEVQAASTYGKGSTFSVTIPFGAAHLPAEQLGNTRTLAAPALGATPFLEESLRWLPETDTTNAGLTPLTNGHLIHSPATESGTESRMKIVLADDNADMRAYVQRLLSAHYEVIAVKDGQEALAAVAQSRPDLVLSDVMMPNLDGFGLLKALRSDKKLADIPIILLSARAGEEARVEGLQSGADDYLIKPFSAPELLARVRGILQLANVRREAAMALHKSEERFVKAFNASPFVLTISSLKTGKLVEVNETFVTMSGYTREEAIGRTTAELGVWAQPLDREEELKLVAQTGRVRNAEYRFKTRDGQELYGILSAETIEVGGEPCALTVIADITERKRAEDLLRENQERERARTEELEALMNAVPALVWFAHDPTCSLITGNRAANDLLRMGEERNHSLSAPEPEQPQHFKVFSQGKELHPQELPVQLAAQGIEVRDFEEEIVFENGERRSLYGHAIPLHDSQGNVRGAVSAFVDITERKRAEDDRERRYRDGLKLTEINRALVGALKLEQVTAIICRAARELTGAAGASFVLRDGERVRYVDEDAMDALWKGRDFSIDCCISGWAMQEASQVVIEDIYQDARIPHDAYATTFVQSLVMTPVGPGFPVAAIGVYWDHKYHATAYEMELLQSLASAADLALVSVRAYDEARRARQQAEDANRLKDDFLATVSHELRTPLNGILGWAKMLRSGKLTNEKTQQALETIERNARSQNRLIEDLLDVSRIISGKMQLDLHPIDLATTVEAALNVVRPTAEAKGVGLYSILEAKNTTVIGDAERLQQVVWNLLSNAIKFTPREGSVLVHLEEIDSHLELTISDTGAGINPAFLPFVFDRFRQADSSITRPHGGLGLGLAIVRHLTELHGGTVRVKSPGEGQGATFIVTLPVNNIARNPPPPLPVQMESEEKAQLEPGLRLDGLRLLVIDDEADARDLLVSMLKTGGAEVVTAGSSADGLQAFAEGPFNVIISDIEMPNEDGYTFIRKVRGLSDQQSRLIPAIALTAHTRTEDRIRALAAGFQSHVSKPVELTELMAVIASLHQQYNR